MHLCKFKSTLSIKKNIYQQEAVSKLSYNTFMISQEKGEYCGKVFHNK